jgi:(5-formylfuran-3-yl)methyl phosphate synthase
MQLLISVVEAAEAGEAAAAGADIIDVKDPTTGALGAAAPVVVGEVRAVTPAHLPVSVALGDGPFDPAAAARAALAVTTRGAAFVKLGLRDTPADRALATLRAVRAALPPGVALVVAGFADFDRARAPHPLDVPALASEAGAQGCLLDTAVKDGRGLFHWLDDAQLRRFVAACRGYRLLSALAGSLSVADLPRLVPIGPDIVGVRGAACLGDRVRGRVSGDRVRALVLALSGRSRTPDSLTGSRRV